MERKKKREIEAHFALTIPNATLPEKRKYWCEVYFDKDLIEKTSISRKTNTPEWSNKIVKEVLEQTKALRIVLYTVIKTLLSSKNEQVGELKIPFSTIYKQQKIDKVYSLGLAKEESSKQKTPKIRVSIDCSLTELYSRNLAIEKRRKLILACPLPKVEIPELIELMNTFDEESGDTSRLILVKSSKNWKWTAGDTIKRKQSKNSSAFLNESPSPTMGIKKEKLQLNSTDEEEISGNYNPIGNDDSENSDENNGYTPIDELNKNNINNNNDIHDNSNHKSHEDKDEDTVDMNYKNIDNNTEDDDNDGGQDGYMIIDDGDDSDSHEEKKPMFKFKEPKKPNIQSKSEEEENDNDENGNYTQATTSSTIYSQSDLHLSSQETPRKNSNSGEEKVDIFKYESFNTRFQNLIENLDELKKSSTQNTDELQDTNMKLIQLAQDFVANATIYGKLIISEHMLPLEMRTIQPIKVGGYLGGDKYKVNDILFKFANDAHGIFGQLKNVGHDPMWAANKVAGHELKGCIDYFRARTDGLSFPLMALVDYKGYRLIAMSVLPIDGSKTLNYGSNDAGEECNVHTDSEELNQKIMTASKNMNLKGHWCGRKGRDKFLYSALDLEGHISKQDNRMYVIDYSRTMPPVYPKGKQGIHGQQFFCLFRSEFVRSYKSPLSPDGFSNFQSRDAKVDNEEIKEATIHLVNERIPKVAVDLLKKFKEHMESKKSVIKFSLSSNLHTYGINMRYSGYLLEHIPENEGLYNLIYVEIIARIAKNRLRHLMRRKLEKVRAPLEAPFNILITNNLNILLSGDRDFMQEKSKNYWEKHIPSKLIPLFKLKEERVNKLGDLRERISKIKFGNASGKYVLLHRIIDMMGLKFTNDILEELETNPEIFELTKIFEYTNLKDIGVRVKHMNIIETIQAEMFLTYYLHRGKVQKSEKEALRHYIKALDAIEEEIKKRPNDPLLITKLAYIINNVEKAEFRIKKSEFGSQPLLNNKNLIRASNYYEQAIRLSPMDTSILSEYAQYLYFWHDVNKAEDNYLRSLEVDPNQIDSLKNYGSLLLKQQIKIGTSFLTRSSHISSQQSIIESFLSKKITSNQAVEQLKLIESKHENFASTFSDNSILKSSKNNLNTTL